MQSKLIKNTLIVYLEGRIDSTNAAETEKALMALIEKHGDKELVIDAQGLQYISSAGLRVLLKVRKYKKTNLLIQNVSDEVFDIFSVTGFSDMFQIKRKMKTYFLQKSDAVVRSINGKIYKQDNDTMIKVYSPEVPLKAVEKEREFSHKALVCGVPTVIPFDVGIVGNCYGIVFESVDTVSLAQAITREPEKLESYAEQFAYFMKELHQIEIEGNDFPNIKDRYREWMSLAGKWLSDKDRNSITALIEGIPDKNTYVHGDIHLSNVVVHDGEMMLMDMASSSCGHPIFDLQGLYASLVAIEKERPMYCSTYFGITGENCEKFWNVFYPVYMGDASKEELQKMTLLLKSSYILKQKLLSVLEER